MHASGAVLTSGRTHSAGTPFTSTTSTSVPSSSGSAPTSASIPLRNSTADSVASLSESVVCPIMPTTIWNTSLAISVLRDADRLLRAQANGLFGLRAQGFGRLFLEHVQEIIRAHFEDLGRDAHADGVALTAVEVDVHSHGPVLLWRLEFGERPTLSPAEDTHLRREPNELVGERAGRQRAKPLGDGGVVPER